MSRKAQSGFSLVEVLVALGVLAFAGMAIFGLFSSGLLTAQETVADIQATLFGREVMNGIRAMNEDPATWNAYVIGLGGPADFSEMPPPGENLTGEHDGWIQMPVRTNRITRTRQIVYFVDDL